MRKTVNKLQSFVKDHPYLSVLFSAFLLVLIFSKKIYGVVITLTRKPTAGAYDIIKKWEGFYSNAYQDSAGIWTIGYGTIQYRNGTKVKKGDTITMANALNELEYEVQQKTSGINKLLLGVSLNDNQYNAIVSLAYNIGLGAVGSSTLLKKVKANPADATIYSYSSTSPVDSCEFLRWVRAGGNVVNGLTNRRIDEAKLYNS